MGSFGKFMSGVSLLSALGVGVYTGYKWREIEGAPVQRGVSETRRVEVRPLTVDVEEYRFLLRQIGEYVDGKLGDGDGYVDREELSMFSTVIAKDIKTLEGLTLYEARGVVETLVKRHD